MFTSRITLCAQIPEYVNKHFYGRVNAKHFTIEEMEFEKFENVNHPDKGIIVYFKDPEDNDCSLRVSKYAWSDHDNGMFEALICDDRYLYELDINCDENGNIIDQSFAVNIYDANDKETLVDVVAVTKWDIVED